MCVHTSISPRTYNTHACIPVGCPLTTVSPKALAAFHQETPGAHRALASETGTPMGQLWARQHPRKCFLEGPPVLSSGPVCDLRVWFGEYFCCVIVALRSLGSFFGWREVSLAYIDFPLNTHRKVLSPSKKYLVEGRTKGPSCTSIPALTQPVFRAGQHSTASRKKETFSRGFWALIPLTAF